MLSGHDGQPFLRRERARVRERLRERVPESMRAFPPVPGVRLGVLRAACSASASALSAASLPNHIASRAWASGPSAARSAR